MCKIGFFHLATKLMEAEGNYILLAPEIFVQRTKKQFGGNSYFYHRNSEVSAAIDGVCDGVWPLIK